VNEWNLHSWHPLEREDFRYPQQQMTPNSIEK
jgi:hypothetical protein